MGATTVVLLIIGILAFAVMGVVLLAMRKGEGNEQGYRHLMGSSLSETATQREVSRRRLYGDDGEELDLESLKLRSGSSKLAKKSESIEQKLFKAGYYTFEDRKRFKRSRILIPIFTVPICILGGGLTLGPGFGLLGGCIGALIGYALPISSIERKARVREEETLYFLPLVIEQISIGVSSSLDIGPCVAEVVRMAEERDAHNPVTEMFVHAEKLMRSGLSLEESLLEVSEVNGQSEVKHAFMFLAQCAKHGGEISKQLQELADATMSQRQVYVEGRIAQLPIKATGPLATVFAGFFALLFSGLFVRLIGAFGGGS